MSQARAAAEIARFLSTAAPEVLSISGRWGVGKTHAWDQAVKSVAISPPLQRYAYVSAFGVRSLEALRTAIFQSTVPMDRAQLEPTVQSFVDHVSSTDGIASLLEQGARKGMGTLGKLAAAVPYFGKAADLLAPGAALLIRDQVICIDDIERAGQGLDVGDILGLVSTLRERRGCKIVLLLNEEGLGGQAGKFQEYLEKVVDQAIRFEPTAEESAAAALDSSDPQAIRVGARTVALGITNIRVIRRIRRFLGHLEPQLAGLHDGVSDRAVQSLALLGWCLFEPKLAPDIDRIRGYNRFSGLFSEEKRSIEELRTDRSLAAYGFSSFEDLDQLILDGLKAGAFDGGAVRSVVEDLDRKLRRNEVREGIARPWTMLGDNLDESLDGFVAALVQSIERHASEMSPSEASDVVGTLRDLGHGEEAGRLVPLYIAAQDQRPREFFAASHQGYRKAIDPAIQAAMAVKLATMPLNRDPAEILLEIGSKNGWNPNDVAFLASVEVVDYVATLKRLRGAELQSAIAVALRFGEMTPANAQDLEVARRMIEALRLISAEGPLNALRLRPYLRTPLEEAEAAEVSATEPGAGSSRA